MKVIIQIPCYNEETTLGVTLAALPRSIPGVGSVEWLVVDDGSADRTVDVAEAYGVDHILRLPSHQGLARAFAAGLEECLSLGAEIIVNTDGDNQYRGEDVEKLVAPILGGQADFVVGMRPIAAIAHFSPLKRGMQRFGSRVVRWASGTQVLDAASGFRAFSREAAMRLNLFSNYSHTLESLIQAGSSGIRVIDVPVRVNAPLRPSRLMRNSAHYVFSSAVTILRVGMIYRPLRFFALLGGIAIGLGILISRGFLIIGGVLWMMGLLAHLIGINRRPLEDIRFRMRAERRERGEAEPDAAPVRRLSPAKRSGRRSSGVSDRAQMTGARSISAPL